MVFLVEFIALDTGFNGDRKIRGGVSIQQRVVDIHISGVHLVDVEQLLRSNRCALHELVALVPIEFGTDGLAFGGRF